MRPGLVVDYVVAAASDRRVGSICRFLGTLPKSEAQSSLCLVFGTNPALVTRKAGKEITNGAGFAFKPDTGVKRDFAS
jgi:hypothetical protein